MDDTVKALQAIEFCWTVVQSEDRYMVHLLKGKCFDKLKQYQEATVEYHTALTLSKSLTDQVRGNITFRLGWARVKIKSEIAKGI